MATRTKILVIHDMVTLYPFEGATNRTASIVVEKPCELKEISSTSCPELKEITATNKKINHVIGINKSKRPIPTDSHPEDVLKETERFEALMSPIVESDVSSPWMQITEKLLPYIRRITQGSSQYEAREGVLCALNQVYFVEVKGKTPDGKLIITNPPEPGQKKKVKQVEVPIEPDLVYPLIRGRDVKKWYVEYKNRYIIVPHDPKTGKIISETDLKVKYPSTYNYLTLYKDELKKRSIKPFLSLKGRLKKANESSRRVIEKELDSKFYMVDNIGSYTFAPYKVVWKYIAGSITGKASSFSCAVLSLINDKIAIPNEKLMLIPFENLDEAYYVSGVLNSVIARTIISSYVVETEISTHITKVINVPKYNPNNNLHAKISDLSKRAHEVAKCIYAETKPDYCNNIRNPEKELMEIEKELDKTVAKLYDIPEDVLDDFRKLFTMLSGEEVPEESEQVSYSA